MTNYPRGEIALMLAGTAVTLCPTFASLAMLEGRLGVGLIAIARKFANGEFTLNELAEVIATGIKGAGGTVPDNLNELIAREGVANLAKPLGEYLARALTGAHA